jgi:hypothetical protein
MKHHYISSVGVTHSGGEARISLVFDVPEVVAADDRIRLVRWVVVKLQEQIALVQPHIQQLLVGQLRVARDIEVETRTEPVPTRRAISEQALRVIRADTRQAEVIDFRGLLAMLRTELDALDLLVLIGDGGPNDASGREDIFDWSCLEAATRATVLRSERLRLLRGGSPSDVIAEWLVRLNASALEEPELHEAERRRRLNQVLLNALAQADPVVLAASSIDLLASGDYRWLVDECFPQLLAIDGVRLHVTAADDVPVGTGVAKRVVRLGSPDAAEVATHFSRFGEGLGEVYVDAGFDYSALRSLSVQHGLRAVREVTA